jgi:hypothetical protein
MAMRRSRTAESAGIWSAATLSESWLAWHILRYAASEPSRMLNPNTPVLKRSLLVRRDCVNDMAVFSLGV